MCSIRIIIFLMLQSAMFVCVCVCVCVCACVRVCVWAVYAFAVCKRAEAHDMHHFQHVIQEIFYYLRSLGVYVFALLRVCAWAWACVFRFVLLVLCLPVWVGKALHDPSSLGNKPFETRDLVPYTCAMWSIVIIVIWPLFRKMPVNQKPLNRIGILWYQFTLRKLLYLLVSLNLVKFGPHWLSVFFFFFFLGGGHPVYHFEA